MILPKLDVRNDLQVECYSRDETVRSLTKAIRSGDEDSFSEFYDLYSGRLYRHLLFLTCGREDVSRELLQITMIKVAHKFPQFERERQLWYWLVQIARNALTDRVRQEKRVNNQCSPVDWLETLPAPDTSADSELVPILNRALADLEFDERALIESAYFDGERQNEIAMTLGTTRKAVESKLARVRAKLRGLFFKRMNDE